MTPTQDVSNEDDCPNCLLDVAEDESRDTSLVVPGSVPKYFVGKLLHDYDATGEKVSIIDHRPVGKGFEAGTEVLPLKTRRRQP